MKVILNIILIIISFHRCFTQRLPSSDAKFDYVSLELSTASNFYTSVQLSKPYNVMVVACTVHIPYPVVRDVDYHPYLTRINGADTAGAVSFGVKLEYFHRPPPIAEHVSRRVDCLVMEEGDYVDENGRVNFAARRIYSEATILAGNNYELNSTEIVPSLGNNVAVVGSVMTSNNEQASVFFSCKHNDRREPALGERLLVGKHVYHTNVELPNAEYIGVIIMEFTAPLTDATTEPALLRSATNALVPLIATRQKVRHIWGMHNGEPRSHPTYSLDAFGGYLAASAIVASSSGAADTKGASGQLIVAERNRITLIGSLRERVWFFFVEEGPTSTHTWSKDQWHNDDPEWGCMIAVGAPVTEAPTRSPTSSPTDSPTPQPQTPTRAPTNTPTDAPIMPTDAPTKSPSASPTRPPTDAPVEAGTPTASPTTRPTAAPTVTPTRLPTKAPTESPVPQPTASPTRAFALEQFEYDLDASECAGSAQTSLPVASSFGKSIVRHKQRLAVFDGDASLHVFGRHRDGSWRAYVELAPPLITEVRASSTGTVEVQMALGDKSLIVCATDMSDGAGDCAVHRVGEALASAWPEVARLRTLLPSEPPGAEQFGPQVSVDGRVAAVGGNGAVSIFTSSADGAEWHFVQQVIATVIVGSLWTNARFGWRVAVHTPRVFVSAPNANERSYEDGAVLVLGCDERLGADEFIDLLPVATACVPASVLSVPQPSEYDSADAGVDRALFGDQLHVRYPLMAVTARRAPGVPFFDALTSPYGHVFVFRHEPADNKWLPVASLPAHHSDASLFGSALAIDSSYALAVGAGGGKAAHLYVQRALDTWMHDGVVVSSEPRFGDSLTFERGELIGTSVPLEASVLIYAPCVIDTTPTTTTSTSTIASIALMTTTNVVDGSGTLTVGTPTAGTVPDGGTTTATNLGTDSSQGISTTATIRTVGVTNSTMAIGTELPFGSAASEIALLVAVGVCALLLICCCLVCFVRRRRKAERDHVHRYIEDASSVLAADDDLVNRGTLRLEHTTMSAATGANSVPSTPQKRKGKSGASATATRTHKKRRDDQQNVDYMAVPSMKAKRKADGNGTLRMGSTLGRDDMEALVVGAAAFAPIPEKPQQESSVAPSGKGVTGKATCERCEKRPSVRTVELNDGSRAQLCQRCIAKADSEDSSSVAPKRSNTMKGGATQSSKRRGSAPRTRTMKEGIELRELRAQGGSDNYMALPERKGNARKAKKSATLRKDEAAAAAAALNAVSGAADDVKLLDTVPRRGRDRADTDVDGFEYSIPFDSLVIYADTPLGKGNFGTVYAGEWAGVPVALKEMPGTVDADVQRHFVREARLMEKIGEHAHIIRFYGASYDAVADNKYLVLELAESGNLAALLRSGTLPLTRELAIRVAYEVADAMSYIHTVVGVLHRDLAARNVLVCAKLVFKLADFGLSVERSVDTGTNAFRQFAVKWLAPETLTDGDFSERSDVWSYGITIWEVWNRAEPYADIGSRTMVKRLATEAAFHPPIAADTPPILADVMRRCFARQPSARPSFAELLAELQDDYEATGGAAAAADDDDDDNATIRYGSTLDEMPSMMPTDLDDDDGGGFDDAEMTMMDDDEEEDSSSGSVSATVDAATAAERLTQTLSRRRTARSVSSSSSKKRTPLGASNSIPLSRTKTAKLPTPIAPFVPHPALPSKSSPSSSPSLVDQISSIQITDLDSSSEE